MKDHEVIKKKGTASAVPFLDEVTQSAGFGLLPGANGRANGGAGCWTRRSASCRT
jgi:hypothetical protein